MRKNLQPRANNENVCIWAAEGWPLQESQSKVQTALMHICADHSQICLQKNSTHVSSERKKGRKTTPMLPPTWIKVLLHFRVDLSLYVILKLTFQELDAPQRLLPPFNGEHLERTRTSQLAPISPKGKPLGFHKVCWKYPIHTNTPTFIGWTTGGRVHQKSSARKVTRPSNYFLALGGSTSEFPWIRVKALGLSYPWRQL